MFYPSRFIGTVAFCALLSGGMASADNFNISNTELGTYSLINSLGQSLNGGTAILGAFNSNSWSYDMASNKWNFESHSYTQDQLTYSDLVNMGNSFTNTLDQTGTVTNGKFNIEGGNYQTSPPSSNSPIYLMVTGEDGDLAVFVFRSISDDPSLEDSLLTYNDVSLSGSELFNLWLAPKDSVSAPDYYAECILGNVDPINNTVQLLIPEPATATLSLLGLAALMMRRRRK